ADVSIISFVGPDRSRKTRSWRNWQTRTFEGRMGNRMGSSPIDRTRYNPPDEQVGFLIAQTSLDLVALLPGKGMSPLDILQKVKLRKRPSRPFPQVSPRDPDDFVEH